MPDHTSHIIKDVVKFFSSRDPSIHPSVLSSKCVVNVKTHSSVFSLFSRVRDSMWIRGHGGSKGGGDCAFVVTCSVVTHSVVRV